MNARHKFIKYVKRGGRQPLVSLQIGAGAGFDCKLAGKEWLTKGTLDDTIRAYEIVECDVLINLGLPEFGGYLPELKWRDTFESHDPVWKIHRWLDTPYGPLHWKIHEQKILGCTPVRYPFKIGDNLDSVIWYIEQYHKVIPYIADALEPTIRKAHRHGAVSIQWALQPLELFGLAAMDEIVLMAMMDADRYRSICDLIREVNLELIPEVLACGADFLFLGGQGAEIISPYFYEHYIIPDSQILTAKIHKHGGLVYSHICSPIEPFLTNGYYNQMGIDLFETLSPPPVGNVKDLAYARRILKPDICTRGNIGLDVLVKGSTADVERETIRVIEATTGYKHIVAASDYLFYDVPLENVKTVVKTVRNYFS